MATDIVASTDCPQSDLDKLLDLDKLVAVLFEEHAAAIRAYICSLVQDRELAHDLTQETYLQLYSTRIRLRKVENHRAWIYRIASHIAFKELRRRKRFAWLPWSKVMDSLAFSWTDTAHDVQQRVVLENALAQLPPDHRATLLLYSRYGFRVREVAEMLEVSESAVKMRLHRARQLFQDAYAFETQDTLEQGTRERVAEDEV